MKLRHRIKEKLNQNQLTRRFLNYDFRTILFTVFSLTLTFAYAVFYAILGIALFSMWYGMLAWYYVMIVIMRSLVVFYHGRKRRRGENPDEDRAGINRARIYGACGVIISLLTLPLSITIMQIVGQKATFSHAGLMIYVSATYTTYKVVMTIRNVVKARRSADMTVRTARGINLADMLVSVLALQTAMFNSFSPDADWSVFNAVTGAVVCLSTVVIGIFMIADCKHEITRIRYEANLRKVTTYIETEKETEQ